MKVSISDKVKDVFNKMIGIEDIDAFIVSEKYDKIRSKCFDFLTVLENISNNGLIDFGDEATRFIRESESMLEAHRIEPNTFVTDLTDVNESDRPNEALISLMSTPKYNKDQLIEAYQSLQHNNPVTEIVNLVNKLSQKIEIYKEKFPDVEPSNHICEELFITNTNGIIFEFSNIDVRSIFVSRSIEDESKVKLIRCIKLLFCIAKETIEEIAKPNINPEEYILVIEEAVKNARKKIPRCDKAFDLMTSSLDLFREKFNSYYRIFLKSGNPSAILTEYIDDVSKSVTDMSPQIKRQFKQIYKQFSKEFSSKGVSGDMESLFGEFDTIIYQYI